ncbi:MAG: VOC family protein [Novosphingobium sp.]|nr:VOC family protein [Novosphingobium sp.]
MQPFFRAHFQNAYITHDMDKCCAEINRRFGKVDWIVFEPDMILHAADGDRQSSVRVALGWHGGHQLEIIEPVSGYIEHYRPVMREDRKDWRPAFHHIAVRRDDQAEMHREIAEMGFPVLFESGIDDVMLFIYIDARETIGHCIEYIWATDEGWAMMGWPEGRPVL